jgi:hypothetical protein
MVDFMEGEIIATQPTVVHLGECFKGRTKRACRVEEARVGSVSSFDSTR